MSYEEHEEKQLGEIGANRSRLFCMQAVIYFCIAAEEYVIGESHGNEIKDILDMYANFYGFSSKPFESAPDPAFLYVSPKHKNALTYLEYGLKERTGIILLTGEVGTGKTTLIRHLLNTLDPSVEAAVIPRADGDPDRLLAMIVSAYRVAAPGPDKSQALEALNGFMVERHAQGGQTLLVIDDAHFLSPEALDTLCMLSNLQVGDQALLQIMLVGQPGLRARLMRSELAQLRERIGVSYHLPSLTQEETAAYIACRLAKAGGKPDIFSPEAADMIYRAGRGVPRAVNILCDAALVYGFANRNPAIDAAIVAQVITDRDGMGLASMPCMDDLQGVEDDILMGRLRTLEQQLGTLQAQVSWRIDDLEKSGQGFKDDLVQQMKDLYDRERDRTDKLLFEYARLKERFAVLAKEGETPKPAPATVPSDDNAELIARMREMLNAEREKNRVLEESNQKLKADLKALELDQMIELDRQNKEFITSAFQEKQRAAKNRTWFR